jgi:hypothetical protein
MSIDAQSFVEAIPMMNNLWTSPLTILVIIGLLYDLIGVSCFAGVGVMISMLCAQRCNLLPSTRRLGVGTL